MELKPDQEFLQTTAQRRLIALGSTIAELRSELDAAQHKIAVLERELRRRIDEDATRAAADKPSA